MDLKDVLNKVKLKISPKKEEIREMNEFTEKLLSSVSGNCKPMICGSVGKNTWLSQRREIDLFLLFPETISKKQLERVGLREAKKIVKKLNGEWKLAYSEHPYLQASFEFKNKEYEVDIVPAFKVRNPSKIKSAVDRTPHHVKFVIKNLKKCDDVRLLKQFCIAHECYGADLKVEGFSGYLCELLIIKYGSFIRCVRAASKWKVGTRLEIKKSDKKFDTPLTFIDPVDPKRNVASVVSTETFERFIRACKEFLNDPNIKHFFPAPIKPLTLLEAKNILNKKESKLLLINFPKPDVLDDILWSQLKKSLRLLSNIMKKEDFLVIRKSCWMNKKNIVLVFEMSNTRAPKTVIKIGPPVNSKGEIQFLKHYGKKAFVDGNYWAVEVKRRFTKLNEFILNYIQVPSKKLRLRGIPSKLLGMNKAIVEIFPPEKKIIKTLPPDFMRFLRKFLERHYHQSA